MNLRPHSALEGSLNCLRCKACQLLPGTNFEPFVEELIVLEPDLVPAPVAPEYEEWAKQQDAETPIRIHCGKVGHRRDARLWRRCGDANPKPRYEKVEAGYLRDTGGDRTCARSEFEAAFLLAAYPSAPKPHLVHLHGRDWHTLLSTAHGAGLVRLPSAMRQERRRAASGPKAALIAAGVAFNEKQSAYIHARHAAAQAKEAFEGIPAELVWPRKFGSRLPEVIAQKRARNEAIKADIVAEVAARGPKRSYDSIRRHPEFKSREYLDKHKKPRRNA